MHKKSQLLYANGSRPVRFRKRPAFKTQRINLGSGSFYQILFSLQSPSASNEFLGPHGALPPPIATNFSRALITPPDRLDYPITGSDDGLSRGIRSSGAFQG